MFFFYFCDIRIEKLERCARKKLKIKLNESLLHCRLLLLFCADEISKNMWSSHHTKCGLKLLMGLQTTHTPWVVEGGREKKKKSSIQSTHRRLKTFTLRFSSSKHDRIKDVDVEMIMMMSRSLRLCCAWPLNSLRRATSPLRRKI